MLKKNLFYNALLSVSSFLFPLISFPYASRILGPDGIGKINFIDGFTQYFIVLSALGIPIYGIREIAKVKDSSVNLDKTFSEIFLIHIISAFFFSILYLLIALDVPKLNNRLDLIYIAIVINFSSAFSLEWFFQGIGNFSYITFRSLLVKSCSLIFLFVFLKNGSHPSVYYAINASVFVCNGISNVLYINKKVKFQLHDLNLKRHCRPLLVIVGSTLSVSIYLILDTIILGFLKNEIAVGYYSTAVRIVKIPFTMITAISIVIIPQISNSFINNDKENIEKLIKKSLSFLMFISIPIAVGLFISSDFLVKTFAGVKFSNSVNLLKVLSPLVVLVAFNNLFGLQILTPIGKEKFLLRAVFIGMFTSIILNFVLVERYSYIGSACANILTEIVVTIICYLYAKKCYNIFFDWELISKSILISMSFILIAYIVRGFNLPYMFCELSIICICAAVYLTFMSLFSRNQYISDLKAAVFYKLKIHKK